MAKNNAGDLRSQLKATPIKKLKKRVDEDNEMVGVSSNEYLNLEDGKTLKIRIFPAHPGVEDFYIPKKCYWLTVTGRDGDPRRTTVLDSKVHGGTKWDLVDEYVKYAKKKWAKDADKLEALTGQKDSLSPSYTWLCYAAAVNPDEELRAKLWEFKKMVRDALNKLAFSEDEDEAIEVDPFTDPDEGLPILVKYMKNPNKKKGENYYEVSFPKKVAARPLTDEEIEYFMTLKPLNEVLPKYGMRDFEKALEGLQNFDDENGIGLFDDDDWLEHVEEIKAQYDSDDSDDDEPKKKAVKKSVKKVEPEEDEEEEETDDEEEDEKPAKKSAPAKKSSKVDDEEEDETDEEEEDDEEEEKESSGDKFDAMDRDALKKYVKDNDLDISIKKSMSDDDLRNAIRNAETAEADESDDEEGEEDEEEEDDAPKSKVSLEDIKRKLAGKK